MISLDIVWIVLDKGWYPGKELNLPVDVQSFRIPQYPATLNFRDEIWLYTIITSIEQFLCVACIACSFIR